MKKVKKTPVEDKTHLTAEQRKKLKGTAEYHQYVYWPSKQLWVKNVRKIKGVSEAKKKAKTYILATQVGSIGEMYLTKEGRLSDDKKDGLIFYQGFDDPETKRGFWQEKTKLYFHVCNF